MTVRANPSTCAERIHAPARSNLKTETTCLAETAWFDAMRIRDMSTSARRHMY